MTSTPDTENPYVIPDATFPGPSSKPSAVAGAQPKVSLVDWNGRLYPEGSTPPERFVRYRYCEQLATWLADKCLRNELGKYAQLGAGDPIKRKEEILEQYRSRMMATRGQDFELALSSDQVDWILVRTAKLLSWPLPTGLAPAGNQSARPRP